MEINNAVTDSRVNTFKLTNFEAAIPTENKSANLINGCSLNHTSPKLPV